MPEPQGKGHRALLGGNAPPPLPGGPPGLASLEMRADL